MRVEKGTLIDNLDIESANGASVPSISQCDTKDLIGYVVADLFWRAYIDKDEPFNLEKLKREPFDLDGTAQFGRRSASGILSVLLKAVYDYGAVDPAKLDGLKEILAESHAKNKKLEAYLLRNLDFLARSYIIAAEVPRPEGAHLIVRYRKSLPLYAQTETRLDRWRLRLGLRPYRFTIPIWLPFIVGSYHFKMISSPGQFVLDHYLLVLQP